MKLYLSSIEIPTPVDLAQLIGKPLPDVKVALITDAKEYYSQRARVYVVDQRKSAMELLGLYVTVIDLRDYHDAATLKPELANHDLIWVMGGNTFCLRYQMRRSGFDAIIRDLLEKGIVYGGDSAGAIITGPSIAGIESADIPEFAEEIIPEGLNLIPYVVLPHVDNPEFADAIPTVRALHKGKHEIIEIKDSQAVIFEEVDYRIVGTN